MALSLMALVENRHARLLVLWCSGYRKAVAEAESTHAALMSSRTWEERIDIPQGSARRAARDLMHRRPWTIAVALGAVAMAVFRTRARTKIKNCCLDLAEIQKRPLIAAFRSC